MDPEKIKAWFETDKGKEFYAELIGEGVEAEIAAKVEKGDFLTKEMHETKVAKALADKEKEGEIARKLDKAVAEIHAIHKVTPESAIRTELEQHAGNPALLDAHIERMKAVAERNAVKQESAPENDPVSSPRSIEQRFDDAVKAGLISEPKDAKERARKLEKYEANCRAYGILD